MDSGAEERRRIVRSADGRRKLVLKRSRNAPRPNSLFNRIVDVLFRWECFDYPGRGRLQADLIGTSERYARNLARGAARLSADRALLIARKLETKAEELRGLAAELRDYAPGAAELSRGHTLANVRKAREAKRLLGS